MSIADISRGDPRADWDLREIIGRGSYGSVYAAHRSSDGTAGAVKMVALEDDFEVTSLAEDVIREVETLSQCSHATVLKYFGAYVHAKCLWLVTELCEGGSVLDVMRAREAPLADLQVCAVAACASAALRYLHENLRITHRDVKVRNEGTGVRVGVWVAAQRRSGAGHRRCAAPSTTDAPRPPA